MALTPPWNERVAPAIHEAGHAVMAHVQGMNVTRLFVRTDGSGEMEISPIGSVLLHGEESAIRQVQVALAGAAAEYHYCELMGYPDDVGCHPMFGKEHDEQRAWRAAQDGCAGDMERAQQMVQGSRIDVDQATLRNWGVIVELAEAVLREGNLSGAALTQFLARASTAAGS